MKQKYLIMKSYEKDKLIVREFGDLDKHMFSLLCEETYDSKIIRSSIKEGKTNLISILRTQNLFPIGIVAEKIAEAVINMHTSENDQSVELFFDDFDLLTTKRKKPKIVDDLEDEAFEFDDLLEDDITDPGFEENEINDVTYPLKDADDDSAPPDDDND
ncbi:MAG: hypothetical protein WBB70_07755 [Desulfobacterales bacterium]|jgi:hypothetical protein